MGSDISLIQTILKRKVEVDDDELKTLALIQFQKTLHTYDLNKDYAGVTTFSEKAWRDIKTLSRMSSV